MENQSKKLRLEDIKVESFVTGAKDSSQTIIGGTAHGLDGIAWRIYQIVQDAQISAGWDHCYSADPGPFGC